MMLPPAIVIHFLTKSFDIGSSPANSQRTDSPQQQPSAELVFLNNTHM
jgi:hypothetical protein